MVPLFFDLSPLSTAAVSGLFSAIWEGTILAVCVLVCLRFLPRLSAASRSLIWMNVFLLLLGLHIVPSFRTHVATANAVHFSPLYLDQRWSLAIAGLWAILTLWRGSQLAMSAIRLHRLAGRATPVLVDPALEALIHGPGGRTAELCTSQEVERPSVFGFFRPRILIPPALLEKLSPLELQQVVLHEMEHLHRGDDWTNLLQKIGLALFPLNPVLLWVDRRLCAEREVACDDSVLRSSFGRKAYAICLTRLAEHSVLRRSLSLALGAWERQSEVVRRVHRILQNPGKSMSSRQAALVTSGVVLAVLGGAIALARSPQLVAFAPLAPSSLGASLRAPSMPAVSSLREAGLPSPVPSNSAEAPHMVETAMHLPSAKAVPAAMPVRKLAIKHTVKPPLMQSQQEWVVLTEWTNTEIQPHVVFAVQQTKSAPAAVIRTYAAVPFGNGWLLVQI
jgi:beta-lactamase regulating signal transducer with metallopeptidase domain